MYFVRLPSTMQDYQLLAIVKTLNQWYNDTDQDISEWASEFELIFRMLAVENALVLNPKYLALDEVMNEFLAHLSPEGRVEYTLARAKLAHNTN